MFTTSKCLYMSSDADGKPINYIEGECLHDDAKPTENIYNGSKLLEMDTSTLYIYDAANQAWRAWE